MGEVRILESAEAVAAAGAKIVAAAILAGPSMRLVMAGGTTPVRAYELLAKAALPWGKVTILFGDERCLPPDDRETNFNLANEALLKHVYPASIHRIVGELGAEEAATRYEPIVAAGPLDLVLLGIGEDGHTASLFPDNAALRATTLVAPVHGAQKPPPDRVTLTVGALRAARRRVIFAVGSSKADAVARARRGELPAGMIDADWLLDPPAAAGIR